MKMRKLWTILTFLTLLCACTQQQETALPRFEHITTGEGLNDNAVQHILGLSDGHMAVTTWECVNILHPGTADGTWDIHRIPLAEAPSHDLPAYHGHYHVYADSTQHLWVKDNGRVWCINLETEQVEPLADWQMDDIFIDSRHRIWTVSDTTITTAAQSFTFSTEWGELQDMEADSTRLFLFFGSSTVACYDLRSHALEYTTQPFDTAEAKFYDRTSLVVRSHDGRFYQLRCGKHRNVFLRFDPSTQQWSTVFETTKGSFHTLCIPSPQQALMTCPEGLWDINLETGQMQLYAEVVCQSGDTLRTGFNTVCATPDGHLWLGSYNDGLLHATSMHASRTYLIYYISGLLLLLLLLLGTLFYAYATRQRRRERRLMNRLRELISLKGQEEVKSESGDAAVNSEKSESPSFGGVGEVSNSHSSFGGAADILHSSFQQGEQGEMDPFVLRAIALVEQNLDTPGYNVEQLAADLCMERTGLYRRLTALLDQTPTLFMRRIRMERAARLLREGRLSISEIAEQTGFQSPGYFSRLFQEAYGEKPSDYAQRCRNQE